MIYIRRIKRLQHLEINVPGCVPLNHFNRTYDIKPIDEATCHRLLQFFESGAGSDSDSSPHSNSIFLKSLHIRIGEWESIKWRPKNFLHTPVLLFIGERNLFDGKMHFLRLYPRKRYVNPFGQTKFRNLNDEYRGCLELHGLTSPFLRDSGNFASVPYDSEWAATS